MNWFTRVVVRTLLAFIIFPTLMWVGFQLVEAFSIKNFPFSQLIGIVMTFAISTLVTLYILDKIVPTESTVESKKGEFVNSRRLWGWIAFALILTCIPMFLLFFFGFW